MGFMYRVHGLGISSKGSTYLKSKVLHACIGIQYGDQSATTYESCPAYLDSTSRKHISYSQYFLYNSMDMGSLLGTILRTILNYKRDPYVHC